MERATESLNSADWFPAPQAAFQERNYDADFRALCFTGTLIRIAINLRGRSHIYTSLLSLRWAH
jgi:hypothetical protein